MDLWTLCWLGQGQVVVGLSNSSRYAATLAGGPSRLSSGNFTIKGARTPDLYAVNDHPSVTSFPNGEAQPFTRGALSTCGRAKNRIPVCSLRSLTPLCGAGASPAS